MNTRTLLAALVGTVVAFFLGWLIFGIVTAGYMEKHVLQAPGLMKTEAEMNLGLMALSNLAVSLAFAWIFDRMGVVTAMGGAMAGAVIGFLFYLSVDLSFLAMTNLLDGPVAAMVDTLSYTVWSACVGGVVGYMLGRGKAKAS